MTPEQQRALALARARKRKAESESGVTAVAKDIALTAANAAGEFAGKFNEAAVDTADFFTTRQVNAILGLAGSDLRIPTFSDATDAIGATNVDLLEDGLLKDVSRGAGSAAGAALGVQGALKVAASKLPLVQPATESVRAGVLRTVADASGKQAFTAGGLAGAGAEIGDEIAGDTGRLVGSVVAPIAPTAVKTAASGAAKRVLRGGEPSRQKVEDRIDVFGESGATPNLGQALDNEAVQGAQTISSKFLGGGPLRKQLDTTRQKIQERLIAIADDVSTVKGSESAGRVIEKGIKGPGGFLNRFKDKSGVLWARVDDAIGDTTPVSLKNTRQAFDTLTNKGVFGEVLNNPLITKLSEISRAAGDEVAYSELKALRSQIGRKLANNDLISDIPRAELKQLYGAISQDIKLLADAQGAGQAYTRANNFTRAGHARIDDFVERIANKVDLDKVFQAVTRGGDGAQTINAFKRSLKPEEWEVVVSNVIRRLGRPTNSQNDITGEGFSVNSFVTQWNRLGDSKNALFTGSKKLNDYKENLNKVARSVQLFKDDTAAQANPSGSGVFAANVGTAGGAGLAVVSGEPLTAASILALVGANNRAAALMSNPGFVRWLAQSTKLSESQMPAHIARLPAIAEATNSTDILGFLQSIEIVQEDSQEQQ